MKKTYYILLFFLIKITISVKAQVLINEVMHKPGTSTSVNQGMRRKEYVEIYNAGCSPVNIGCWVVGSANQGIQTAANPAYTGAFQFPAGTIINPGQHIVVGGTLTQDNTAYPAVDIDFDVADYIGTNTCDPNTNWLLPNGDGTMALYDNTGTVVDAIYWSVFSNPNIATDDDFASNPCVPTACSGITSLASARQIAATFPTRITYVGLATNYDMTFSRIPDGGAWQRDIAPSIIGANNCNGGTCASISSFSISATLTNPTCGSSNGSATVTPNPAGAYTYTWTSPAVSTTNTATGLSSGAYTVTVGQGGCTTNTVINLTNSGSPTITATQTLAANCGLSDGSATVTATPGSTFTWSPSGGNASTATGLSATNYTITAELGGCQTTTVITIPSAGGPTITATQTLSASCGLSDGSATVTATPGSTFTWSPSGGNASTATGLSATNYTITAGLGGCSVQTVITIPSAGGPTITATQTLSASCGLSDGSATVTATPGSTFTWSPNGGNASTATGLSATNYTITASLSGCSVQTVITIPSPTPNILITQSITPVSCKNNDGSFEITSITGPNGPHEINFNNSGFSTTTLFENLISGSYSVIIRDVNNCEQSQQISVPTNYDEANLTVPNVFTPNNDKANDLWYPISSCMKSITTIIYNRWGEKMAELNDGTQKWDGKSNGKEVPDGKYFYVIEANGFNGKTITEKGFISLFR